MRTEANKAVLRRYIDELNNRNVAILDELVADEFREWVRRSYHSKVTAFPDYFVEVQGMIAEGDQVAVEWTYRGAHRGPYEGIPPTGKSIAGRVISIYRVVDGRITESRGVSEPGEIGHQLGSASETEEIREAGTPGR